MGNGKKWSENAQKITRFSNYPALPAEKKKKDFMFIFKGAEMNFSAGVW